MLNLCGIVVAILKITIRGAILHFQNFRDVCHFQNGCQNTALKMGGKNSTLSDIIKI
jgi:hypothetical protein